jgi:transposase
MRGPKPRQFSVSQSNREALEDAARRWSAESGFTLRCRMLLLLAGGHGPTSVARQLGVSDRVVRKWRARWEERPGLESLRDGARPGRPSRITVATRCHVIQLACNPPKEEDAPSRCLWSQQSLADALYRTLGEQISRSSVQRILNAEGLRPHRVRQWVHSPDPDFTTKVQRICDIYLDPPEDAVVLCIDEKPIQALRRCYPKHISAGGFVREEFEYKRKGVRHLLAAFDIRTGRVIGRMVKHRGAKAMVSFLDHVARRHPGQPIIIVWDNLNIHCDGKELRWTRFNERHGGRFTFVHTPLHASWVNQVEIWFSILQRRVLRNGSFDSLDMLHDRVLGFVQYWNRYEARPFRWTFNGEFVQTPERLAA